MRLQTLSHRPATRLLRLAAIGTLACAAAPALQAAPDLVAGKARAEAVCAACHGANGVSVADAIPNLAGQRALYLENQLKALRDGQRKNPVMNAIAAQLAPEEISNLAAYFAALPVQAGTTKSAFMPALASSPLALPADFPKGFTAYHQINFPATRQVRVYWANEVALKAAREGRTLPDGSQLFVEVYAAQLDADKQPLAAADGFYQRGALLFLTGMGRAAGWGREVPELLRNEDWTYAAYTTAKQLRPSNQAECLACHKPLDKSSFLFTLAPLTSAARR